MDARDGFKNCEKSLTLSKCTFLDPRFKHLPFMNINSTVKNEIIENTAQIIHVKDTDIDKSQPSQSDIYIYTTDSNIRIWRFINLE